MLLTDKITAVADAIRNKTGKTNGLTLDQMVNEIANIETNNTNFNIIGSTIEPNNPEENAIWINTDINIGEYQYTTKPNNIRLDGSILMEGDVWIEPFNEVSYNSFNIDKIRINIKNIYIYSNGQWTSVQYKIYQNNKWKKS